jgi:hypothetical protein
MTFAQLRDSIWLRRLMFAMAHGAVAFAALNLVILPIHDFFADRDTEISNQRELLARLSAIANQESAVRELARQTEANSDPAEFLRGPNEGVISADLQTQLKAMVQTANARLRSVRGLSPRTDDGVKFIGAQIDVSGTHSAIYHTINAIETANPSLFVVGATIKPTPQMTARPGNGRITEEPTIDAELDVIGAVQIQERR